MVAGGIDTEHNNRGGNAAEGVSTAAI